jgi:hypothetical protein
MARPRASSPILLPLLVGALLASTAASLSGADPRARRQRLWAEEEAEQQGRWREPRTSHGGGSDPRAAAIARGSAILDPTTNQLHFDPDPSHPEALAHGAFLDARHTSSNFGKLRLVTGSAADARQRRRQRNDASASRRQNRPHAQDRAEAFASGWLEGWLTAERIYDHWFNMDRYFRTQLNASMERPMAWLRRNDAWVRRAIAKNTASTRGDEHGVEEEADNNGHDEKITDKQYWATVDLIVAQADGIAAGYGARSAHEAAAKSSDNNAAASAVPPLTADDLLFLNGNGDLYDVIDMYDAIDSGELPPEEDDGGLFSLKNPHHHNNASSASSLGPWARKKYGFDSSDAARVSRDIELQGHCSALVKVAADLSDVFFAHSTWDSFTAMTRIYKHLDWSSLQGPAAPLAAPKLSHSGYPGEVASDDDFYLASSGLLVTEATLHVFDPKALLPLVQQRGQRVLSWVRVRAATALASTGEAWVEVLGREQSGTYNNAFMVVDLKRFVPSTGGRGGGWGDDGDDNNGDSATATASATENRKNRKLPGLYPGFLWLAEQLPNKLPATDLTSLVALGYAAAYNVPRDQQIYKAAGYPAAEAEAARVPERDYGTPSRLMSYQSTPRAQLFRRDQGLVQSLRDAQRLMRSNAYKTDPLSEGFPVAAVCARGDLISRKDLAAPKGCYDTKVTSWSLAWGSSSSSSAAPPPLAAEVVGGPTLGGRLAREANDAEDPADPADGPLPAFKWDPVLHRDYAHRGMHEGEYRFKFERQQAEEDLALPGDAEEAEVAAGVRERRRAAAAAS